jgi:16S rRNA (cytosine967-C5)-methyltransferase
LAAFIAGAGLLPGASKVVDFCAGGGGKTLALAQMMDGNGEIYACDVVEKRLKAIEPRLIRAGASAHFMHFFDPDDTAQLELLKGADLVLVDAPCSGSGTWRRHPEEAHRLNEAKVADLHTLQTQILDRAAQCVKVGGRLIYVTCSVLDDENARTADAFEAAHPNYDALPIHTLLENSSLFIDHAARLTKLAKGHRLSLTPHKTQTDGFFIAAYTRIQ